MPAVPFKDSALTKKGQVEEMFDQISHRYDLLNHLLSANIDKIWRRKAIELLSQWQPRTILDVATGTADFAIAAARIRPDKITGIDLSEGMLKIGQQKIKKLGLSQLISLLKADSEALPFEDNSFDAVTVGFGVRNFENLHKGLSEIHRVLRNEGVIVILEFSRPENKLFGKLYLFYFTKILPFLGKIISRNNRAYSYLPESVQEFPDGNKFLEVLNETGYKNCSCKTLTMGIASIYTAQKIEKQAVIQ